MIIEIFHHLSYVKNATPEEVKFIDKKLTAYKQKFHSFKRVFETHKIFDKKTKGFLTGYLQTLEKELKENNMSYTIEDRRVYPSPTQSFSMSKSTMPPMWKTQEEAFQAIQDNYIGIIAKATGSGKTRLIFETINLRRNKTLILVPNNSIKKKTYDEAVKVFGKRNVSDKAPSNKFDYLFDLEIEEEKEEIETKESDELLDESFSNLFSDSEDTYQSGKEDLLHGLNSIFSQEQDIRDDLDDEDESPEDEFLNLKSLYKHKDDDKKLRQEKRKKIREYNKESKPITIICYQALQNISKKFLEEIECLIIDECHSASTQTIRNAVVQMPNAAYRYFFSATPWRDMGGDMKLLISVISTNVLYELRGKDAVEEGIISQPIYKLINPLTPKKWLRDIKKNNRRELLEQGIIGNSVRNAQIVQEAMNLYAEKRNIFIAVDEISHMKILEKRFQKKGIEPLLIYGEMNSWEKEANIKEAGEHDGPLVTIGTMAVGEGTDMPAINAVIIASGGKSTIRFIQRIGRGTRKTEKDFIVIDFFDWYHDKLIEWSKARIKTFKQEFEELKGLDKIFEKYN